MTTIVYDHKNKLIACDSLITKSSGVISSDVYEKFRYIGAELFFIAGMLCDFDLFIEFKNGRTDTNKGIPEISAFKFFCNSVYECNVNCQGYYEELKVEFNASIGSGSSFALAALDFGKSAAEAVEYAATKDCFTGGLVRVFDVKIGRFI